MTSRSRRRDAHAALRTLAAELNERGITRIYGSASPALGVLSLPGVTIWTNGTILRWNQDGEEITWPAADAPGAAARLADLAQHGRPHPLPATPGRVTGGADDLARRHA